MVDAARGRRRGHRRRPGPADGRAALERPGPGRGRGSGMVRAIWEHEVVTVAGSPTSSPATGRPRGRWWRSTPATSRPTPTASSRKSIPSTTGWACSIPATTCSSPPPAPPWGRERSAGLPPDWVGLDRATGQPGAAAPAARRHHPLRLRRRPDLLAGGPRPSTGRATAGPRAYLSQAGFLRDEVQRKGEVSAAYAHDGTIVEQARQRRRPGRSAGRPAQTLDPPACPHRCTPAVLRGPGRLRRHDRAGDGRRPAGRRAPLTGPTRTTCTPRTGPWFATALYANALPNLWNNPFAAGDGARPPGHAAGRAGRGADPNRQVTPGGRCGATDPLYQAGPRPPSGSRHGRRRGGHGRCAGVAVPGDLGAGLGRGVDAMRQDASPALTPASRASAPAVMSRGRAGSPPWPTP